MRRFVPMTSRWIAENKLNNKHQLCLLPEEIRIKQIRTRNTTAYPADKMACSENLKLILGLKNL